MKHNFFVYCNESGFDTHETIEGAIEDANGRIPNYLGGDGWSEDVASVCVGKITHRAKMCDQVFPDGEIDEDGIDEAGEYWDSDYECKCNYKMLPVKKQSPDHLDDAPELDQEPVAWIINHSDWSSSEPVLKKNIAERYELDQPGCTVPLYLHPQPAPDVSMLVGVLEKCREIINPPKQDCSCHISPPCADCVDYGFERELADEIDAALATYRQQVGDEDHYINCLRTAKSLGYDTVHGALQAISKMKAEPTKAMCIAGCNVAIKDLQSEADWIGDIYRAMVAEREGGGYTSRNESFAFRADGEANFYTVSERGGNWTARIQFNGEFMCDEQERMTAVITDALAAYRTQDDEIPMHSCVMQLDKLRSEPKPLTADELKAGGWWCADTSDDALKAFILYGLVGYGDDTPWDGSYYGCFIFESGTNLLDRGYKHHTSALKQIHRIGNNFYWGATSDQAN